MNRYFFTCICISIIRSTLSAKVRKILTNVLFFSHFLSNICILPSGFILKENTNLLSNRSFNWNSSENLCLPLLRYSHCCSNKRDDLVQQWRWIISKWRKNLESRLILPSFIVFRTWILELANICRSDEPKSLNERTFFNSTFFKTIQINNINLMRKRKND